MINKIGEDYFIVDCWNHRVIYSDSLDKNIEEWKTLTSDNYVGGYTVCSDGEIIVLDNTDNSQIIVYEKRSGGDYACKQVISNVEGRPHYVIYDEMHKYFYIIGSTVGNYFDDKYYITEISAECGNGIKSFTVHDGIIEDLETLFYWGDVDEVSRKRYNDVESLCNSDERVDLVLFAGQSNMAGKGNSKDAPIVCDRAKWKRGWLVR